MKVYGLCAKHQCHWAIVLTMGISILALGVHLECVEECLPGYLDHCENQVQTFNDTLKLHKDDRVCTKLQDVIKCIGAYSRSCIENATHVFDQYTKEPYECELLTEEIILLVQNNGPIVDCNEESAYEVTGNSKVSSGKTVTHQTPQSSEQSESPTGSVTTFHGSQFKTFLLVFIPIWLFTRNIT